MWKWSWDNDMHAVMALSIACFHPILSMRRYSVANEQENDYRLWRPPILLDIAYDRCDRCQSEKSVDEIFEMEKQLTEIIEVSSSTSNLSPFTPCSELIMSRQPTLLTQASCNRSWKWVQTNFIQHISWWYIYEDCNDDYNCDNVDYHDNNDAGVDNDDDSYGKQQHLNSGINGMWNNYIENWDICRLQVLILKWLLITSWGRLPGHMHK